MQNLVPGFPAGWVACDPRGTYSGGLKVPACRRQGARTRFRRGPTNLLRAVGTARTREAQDKQVADARGASATPREPTPDTLQGYAPPSARAITELSQFPQALLDGR